jgi:lysophospholipase L1-like esterase
MIQENKIENPFKDKWISIIGDSISTFKDYTRASTYDDFYPSTTTVNDVNDVSQTWWHILLTKLGAKLCVNNSIGGSYICNPESCTRTSLLDRINNKEYCRIEGNEYINLDGTKEVATQNIEPDYIIVYMGTNDWGSKEKDLGITYNEDKTIRTHITLNTFDKLTEDTVIYNVYKALEALTNSSSTKVPKIYWLEVNRAGSYNLWRVGKQANGIVDEFNDTLEDLVSKVYAQNLVPYRKLFNVILKHNKDCFDSSSIHPNAKGMKIIADQLYLYLMTHP